METFGEVILREGDNISLENLIRVVKRPFIRPRFRISVLNPDESVSYVIPYQDIPENGLSYSEEYQTGQRRSLQLTLLNISGKYTPNVNGLWLNAKFSFEVGIDLGSDIKWFPKGVYIMGDVSLTDNDSDRTLNIQLKDKYSQFEGKMGTLQEAYEIPVNSDIYDALVGILNFSKGDGYIFDYKPPFFHPNFIGKKTQSTIRVEEGGNIAQVIDELVKQLSAECYYNSVGNLCVYPLEETINDYSKPVIWVFESVKRELQNMGLNLHNEEVVNVVKVVGDNIDSGVYSAVVTNENPASPICIQRVGKRAAPTYKETSVWSDELAQDLANYYLRQSSFISVDFSTETSFNPFLTVNNIVEVENKQLDLKREKLLITSISFSSQTGNMELRLCNINDLPFMMNGGKHL